MCMHVHLNINEYYEYAHLSYVNQNMRISIKKIDLIIEYYDHIQNMHVHCACKQNAAHLICAIYQLTI